jgi:hypothetical protein
MRDLQVSLSNSWNTNAKSARRITGVLKALFRHIFHHPRRRLEPVLVPDVCIALAVSAVGKLGDILATGFKISLTFAYFAFP